ncbi:MAG: uracil-DNA glycosylase family protein [Pseudomonadales bacterium]|nr:uracil-DNA glycosylase family protein [Pseudomonadales bacterium]NRA18707.1 uracil-DNA glycosylase family protein [Oceanospirillaceae bacterium]
MQSYLTLLAEVRRCTLCEPQLPMGARPVLQLHPEARILIAGQAPGRKVHLSGIPFDDASGIRLREWLGISADTFYDPQQIALLPMGFCFPGTGKSDDLPPRAECAATWRTKLLQQLHQIQLTIVLGKYAQAYHLPGPSRCVTDSVSDWRNTWPAILPIPHPSPRNNIWLRRNPWFEREVVPALQRQVAEVLAAVN